ncbi:MAG: hypothetical protein M0T84_04385 [Betaproteobacteria bacterium]|nr:hypothetical protein [Betaproteobacteria bacterium]
MERMRASTVGMWLAALLAVTPFSTLAQQAGPRPAPGPSRAALAPQAARRLVTVWLTAILARSGNVPGPLMSARARALARAQRAQSLHARYVNTRRTRPPFRENTPTVVAWQLGKAPPRLRARRACVAANACPGFWSSAPLALRAGAAHAPRQGRVAPPWACHDQAFLCSGF